MRMIILVLQLAIPGLFQPVLEGDYEKQRAEASDMVVQQFFITVRENLPMLAPKFHDERAADIADIVDFYSQRFSDRKWLSTLGE